MKKLILPFCFALFLSAGLVSCSDEAADITPHSQDSKLNSEQYAGGEGKGEADGPDRPTDD